MKKKTPLFNTVTIVGVGLIGGSLGMAIKKNKLAERVVGVGHRRCSIQKAIKKRAIDEGTVNLKSGVKQADLVILATPVGLIIKFLKEGRACLRPGSLVIDVGSSKEEIVKAAEKNFPREISFIGCHPMAGSEKRGIEIARADLFKKAVCIITPGGRADAVALRKVKVFWQRLGTKVEIISPAGHDRLIALLSHLPHLIAASLVLKLEEENRNKSLWLKLAGPGFKDTTRIAASSPLVWQDIYFSNRANIIKNLRGLKKILERLESYLQKGREKDFLKFLDKAKRWREEMS